MNDERYCNNCKRKVGRLQNKNSNNVGAYIGIIGFVLCFFIIRMGIILIIIGSIISEKGRDRCPVCNSKTSKIEKGAIRNITIRLSN
jgi:Zn finger protein HypA/HybF involved in hydrogenase expression